MNSGLFYLERLVNKMINDIPEKDKPREKALRYGMNVLSAKELLAVLLRNGYKGKSVLEVAEELLHKAGGIQGIPKLSIQELCSVKGIHTAKALELKACFELGRRISFETVMDENVMKHQEELVRWIQNEIGSSLQEQFMVIFLDHFNRIKAHQILFTGCFPGSNPAELFGNDSGTQSSQRRCCSKQGRSKHYRTIAGISTDDENENTGSYYRHPE